VSPHPVVLKTMLVLSFLSILFLSNGCHSFQLPMQSSTARRMQLFSSFPSDTESIPTSILERIELAKEDVVRLCSSSSKPSLEAVRSKVQDLEELAEQGGIGQASAHSGLLSGEW